MPELLKTILKDNSNLKAYWRFENGALTTDTQGTHTLTNNGTITDATGKFGGGADLEASSSQYFSLANNADFNFGTGDYAFGGWYKRESTGAFMGFFAKIDVDADGYRLNFQNDDKINFLAVAGATSVNLTSSSTYTDTSSFHLLIATRISGVTTIYHDGEYVMSSSTAVDVDSTNNIHIGTYRSTAALYFDGILDDMFVIKGSGLTPHQIKQLYEGYYIGEHVPSSSTKALYHLSGPTDFSGSNYHGTVNSAVLTTNGKIAKDYTFTAASKHWIDTGIGTTDILGGSLYRTFCAWIKPASLPGNNTWFFVVELAKPISGLSLYNNAGTQQVQYYHTDNAGNATPASYNVTLSTGVWYWLCGTWDGTTAKVFLNGALVGQTSIGNSFNTGTGTSSIGRYSTDALYFNGEIDEVLIENRAWTDAEIRRYYAWIKGQYL